VACDGLPIGHIACPYGEPGDRLWVRETWRCFERPSDGVDGVLFRADDAFQEIENTRAAADAWVQANDKTGKWRPSIFMPRWASRIDLEVTEVRVQRLDEISEEDARAEGVVLPSFDEQVARGDAIDGLRPVIRKATTRGEFSRLWDSINAERGYGWAANPWVWAITFRRVRP
jgi:hypothetical protein